MAVVGTDNEIFLARVRSVDTEFAFQLIINLYLLTSLWTRMASAFM